MTNIQVVVSGAGPSGLMTAMELAAAGVAVMVLEKRGEPALSRAGVLQPRVLEIFAMRGFADQVLERANEVNGAKHRTASGIWAGLPGIDYGLLDSEYPWITVLSQLEVERILAERCRRLGVEIRRGWEVVSVAQDAESVVVSCVTPEGEQTVRADYVVGADGARSAVRTSSGIDWNGHAARNVAINVDGEVAYPFADPITVVNNERGWGLSYPLSETVTRFGIVDASTMLGVGRDFQVDLDGALNSLRRVFGDDYGVTQARISQFHDALYRAGRLRHGRVLLVGESVRVHYPASGVGMNFCLQDAFNLAWKLAAEIQGWAPPGLLDSYDGERGADVDALIASVRTQTGIQFCFTDEALAIKDFLINRMIPLTEVQRTLAEQLSGLQTHYGTPGAFVGSAIRNLPAGDGGVFDAVRPDGYLLLVAPGVVLQEAWGDRVSVREAELPAEADGVAVVRPDGYVAAAGPAASCLWLESALAGGR